MFATSSWWLQPTHFSKKTYERQIGCPNLPRYMEWSMPAFQAARTPVTRVGNKGHSLTSINAGFFSEQTWQILQQFLHISSLYIKAKQVHKIQHVRFFGRNHVLCIFFGIIYIYIVRRYQNTAYNYNNLIQNSIHVLYFERLTLRLKDRWNYVTMIFPLCPVNKQKTIEEGVLHKK